MSAFSWRCQYCNWAFQMSPEAVAAALAAADANQERHHVEHCPRCRKALKIPVDQLRRHAPASVPTVFSVSTRSESLKEDEKTMIETPVPPAQPPQPPVPPQPVLPMPSEMPAAPATQPPAKKPVVVRKPAAKKPIARKPAKKAVKKKPAKKVAKKAAKKPVKKAAKKTVKKKSRK